MGTWGSFVVAGIPAIGMILAGYRNYLGWVVCLVAQIGSATFGAVTEQWGFTLWAPVYTVIYASNLIRWRRDHKRELNGDKGIEGEMKGTVIVDIDGTLAHMGKQEDGRRGPFDWDRVDEDDPNFPVIELVKVLYNTGYDVVLVSGRMEAARRKTKTWLAGFGLGNLPLYMRPDDDYRPDTEVKMEIFKAHIDPIGPVAFVLDDRNSVVKMWRELGLTCLQVADGNF